MTEADIRCLFFKLFYTIYYARKNFEFSHYDLHSGNIRMNRLPQRRSRQDEIVTIEGKKYMVFGDYIPKIIDFGMSKFGEIDDAGVEDVRMLTQELFDFTKSHVNNATFREAIELFLNDNVVVRARNSKSDDYQSVLRILNHPFFRSCFDPI